MPKGWPKGKPQSLEHSFKRSEAMRKIWNRKRGEKADTIIAQLKCNGIMNIANIKSYNPRLIRQYQDNFVYIDIVWSGGAKRRGGTQKGSRFIKDEFMDRTFLGLKSDRTALVRFFMTIFHEDREYNKHDAKALNHWLRRFGLSRAERVAIITKLGYKYRSLKHMMINGYLNPKPPKSTTAKCPKCGAIFQTK